MKSIKTPYFFLALVLILSASLFLTQNKTTKIDELTQPQTTKLIDRVKQFPGLQKPNLSEQEKASHCAAALESIETLPLKTLLYDIQNDQLKLDPKCFESQTQNWSTLQDFPEACLTRVNNELSQTCVQSLFSYKTIRIHQATANENVAQLSLELLINRLMALLNQEMLTSADGKKMLREVGMELRSRLPDSDSAAKAAALGYLIEDQLDTQNALAFQELLGQLRTQFPESWDIFEMELVHLKTADSKKYVQSITDHYQSHPDSAIATYHWGCLSWQKGQAQPARELFRKAASIKPDDKRFSQTYDQSVKVNPPEKVCQVQISFNPESF
jgi:tetratricopeptide (TPR) repeat protein